jgi:CheY-like chemotaxis protein
MSGFEVCERARANPALCDIPIIFLSARHATEDKLRGFRLGGADYVAKPFQLEEVEARVETHLRLRRALQAERELLERTLGGAVSTLLELVQLTSPKLLLRSHSIRDIVRAILRRLQPADAWQYELAATLCLVGCMILPDELFEKAWADQHLSAAETQAFRRHAELAAGLLAHIPRLETAAEMIRRHMAPGPAATPEDRAGYGAHMLHLAVEFDRRLYRGVEAPAALAQLGRLAGFDAGMLEALAGYAPVGADFELRSLSIRELRTGMVLAEDVYTANTRALIFKEGVLLTPVWLDRLANFARTSGVQEKLRVRVPTLAAGDILPRRA